MLKLQKSAIFQIIKYKFPMNYYNAFGLQIASEIELPGLLSGTGKIDLNIKLGKVPDKLSGIIKNRGAAYELTEDYFLLKIRNVAKFLVKKSEEIIIEKLPGASNEQLSLYTINTPIGVVLHRLGNIPLHASAVAFGDFCAVFTGMSGAGKSTISTALNRKGYHLLTEEICAVSLSEKKIPVVHPGAAYTYLWRNTLDFFGYDKNKLFFRPNNPEKYRIPVNNNFCEKALPMKRLYVLSTKNSPDIETEEITGKQKFLPIRNNTYRYRIGKAIGKHGTSFMLHTSIGKHTIVKRIKRPNGKMLVNEIVELIEKDIQKIS